MMTLNISGTEYKVKFGYNSFADSDLLERVQEISLLLNGAETDNDVSAMGKMRELFVVVRELLFEGFKKNNPVNTVQDVGDLLDIYMDETPDAVEGEEVEDRGIFALFLMLANELANEGFLADFVAKMNQATESIAKKPQDHKRTQKKK